MLSDRIWHRLKIQFPLTKRNGSMKLQVRYATTQVADSKRAGDISDAFVSLSGVLKDAEPLDDRYRLLKEKLLGRTDSSAGWTITQEKWSSGWSSLLNQIKEKAVVIQKDRTSYVPTI